MKHAWITMHEICCGIHETCMFHVEFFQQGSASYSLFQLMHMSHDDHAQLMKCAMVSLSVHVQSLQ